MTSLSKELAIKIKKIEALVGNTPIVKLERIIPEDIRRKGVELFVKLEYLNPTGSHKDRIAVYMIKKLIEQGVIKEDSIIVEASSGNTAISVAWVASILGIKTVIVVDEESSREKLSILKALGAKVVKAPGDRVIEVAKSIARKLNAIFLYQYGNKLNHEAHYRTTGPEIFSQLKGKIDYFVMGMGTCGTITGVGRYLKEVMNGEVKVVGVVPKGAVMAGGSGGDRIEGLISSFTPELCRELSPLYVDEIIEVSFNDALTYMLKLAREEGVLGGLSTGANVYASLIVAKRAKPGSRIVTLAADSIFRYTGLLQES